MAPKKGRFPHLRDRAESPSSPWLPSGTSSPQLRIIHDDDDDDDDDDDYDDDDDDDGDDGDDDDDDDDDHDDDDDDDDDDDGDDDDGHQQHVSAMMIPAVSSLNEMVCVCVRLCVWRVFVRVRLTVGFDEPRRLDQSDLAYPTL
jgi:hypothetical protein